MFRSSGNIFGNAYVVYPKLARRYPGLWVFYIYTNEISLVQIIDLY